MGKPSSAYGTLHSHQNDGQDVPLPVSLMIDPEGVIRYKSKFDDSSILSEDELDQVLAASQTLQAT